MQRTENFNQIQKKPDKAYDGKMMNHKENFYMKPKRR